MSDSECKRSVEEPDTPIFPEEMTVNHDVNSSMPVDFAGKVGGNQQEAALRLLLVGSLYLA